MGNLKTNHFSIGAVFQGVRLARTGVGVLLMLLVFNGCGYYMQSGKVNELAPLGIRKVYIDPIRNETFAPGADNWVQSGLVKAISQHGKLKIVSQRSEADAVISGRVITADYGMAAQTSASDLKAGSLQTKRFFRNRTIATLYTANLNCQFQMLRTRYRRDEDVRVWGGGFSRSKQFPGSNQLGALGKTAALINESEFERALRDLVDLVMLDVHESMLARF